MKCLVVLSLALFAIALAEPEAEDQANHLDHCPDQRGFLQLLCLFCSIPNHTLLPDCSGFTAHSTKARHNWFNLLARGPLEDTVRRLQAKVRCLQEDIGKGKAGYVGGAHVGIAARAFLRCSVKRWRSLLQRWN